MTKRSERVRPVVAQEKLAWWISRRLNVLFRCAPGVGFASDVKSAFDKSGLRWQALSAQSGEVEQALADISIEAVFFDGLDRMAKKFRPTVLAMLGERPSPKMIWATVTVSHEDFDLETVDPATSKTSILSSKFLCTPGFVGNEAPNHEPP